jgi:nicotinamidase-related amidase
MAKRIDVDKSCGVIVDYQDYFLSQLEPRPRSRLRANTRNFVRLLGYFRIPTIATLERPVYAKGAVPDDIKPHLGSGGKVFEKDFFDLTREKPIRAHLKRLKKTQAIVAGCETDVCVLQSCLGLCGLGFEVFVVEDLLFSSSGNVDAAIARMKAEGVVFVTYKTLFYELLEAVQGDEQTATFGYFPNLPDAAV